MFSKNLTINTDITAQMEHSVLSKNTQTLLYSAFSDKSSVKHTQPSEKNFVRSVLVRPQQCQKHILVVTMGVVLHCLLEGHAVAAFVHLLDYLEVNLCTGGYDAGQGCFVSSKLVEGKPDNLLEILLGATDQTNNSSKSSKEIILWIRFQILGLKKFMLNDKIASYN